MKAIGIICEFNPLHNGHIYFIESVKKKFPNYVVILIVNGYFLQRGEVSILSKEDKVFLSLKYGIDIVIEHPILFSTQSADTFSLSAIKILNEFNIEYLVFGSESNDVEILEKISDIQQTDDYNVLVKSYLDKGINYPTALAKSLNLKDFDFTPNDLLGISYVKAIKTGGYNIKVKSIKRTNDFHDNESVLNVVSASNIRKKIEENITIDNYLPLDSKKLIKEVDNNKFFSLLKYKILTDHNLSIYLDVDEGLDNKLKKEIMNSNDLSELIFNLKSKRYTYNRINRMLIHVLLGIRKSDNKFDIKYINILGFNKVGQKYLSSIKDNMNIQVKKDYSSLQYKYEMLSSIIYSELTNVDVYQFELKNIPILVD